MQMLPKLLSSEISHYQKLSKEGQLLLISFFLFYLANSLLWTFSTAFLWRQTHDIRLVTLYSVAIFFGIAFGYYVNGKLLQYFLATTIYRVGLIAQGVVFILLVFVPLHSFSILPFGLLFGIM